MVFCIISPLRKRRTGMSCRFPGTNQRAPIAPASYFVWEKLVLARMLDRGLHKTLEQAMPVTRCRCEFRVELAGHEPGMIRHLNHFNQGLVARAASNQEASLLQLRQVVVVDLITVPVTLHDALLAIATEHIAVWLQHTLLGAQAHGTAQIGLL